MYCIMENEELEMKNEEFLYTLLSNLTLNTQYATCNIDLSEVP